jgi:hypothetical protein
MAAYALYLDGGNVNSLLDGLRGNPFEIKFFTQVKDDQFSELIAKIGVAIRAGTAEGLFTTNKVSGTMSLLDCVGPQLDVYIEAMNFQGISKTEKETFFENVIERQSLPYFIDVVPWDRVIIKLGGKYDDDILQILTILVNDDRYGTCNKIIAAAPNLAPDCRALLQKRMDKIKEAQAANTELLNHLQK